MNRVTVKILLEDDFIKLAGKKWPDDQKFEMERVIRETVNMKKAFQLQTDSGYIFIPAKLMQKTIIEIEGGLPE